MSEESTKPDFELGNLLGKDKQVITGEICFQRYISGESLINMAIEFGIDDVEVLRRWIQKAVRLSEYKEGVYLAKEAREIIKYGKLKRIISIGRERILKKLEDTGNLILDVQDLCRIEKTYGDRLALAVGDPTEIQKKDVTIVTFQKAKEENNDTV